MRPLPSVLCLLASVLCLLTSVLCPLATAADKPVPAKEAAAKFTLPKGFSATLFAGEPDIVQPIAFTFDDRGRMWVVECVMYPKWSQDGKGGKDRVVILEDTDGDGKHDKKTVVIDDGVNLSGIELGFGGVYLCSSPNLIFVPIKDDKPGKAEILLDGWNIKEAKHNVFNGLVWGPDGWLYGCNGIQTKSKVGKPGTPDKDRVLFDCGVWRFHPTRKVFEVVATGTTNPWGLDFDEHGEMFITNCVIDHLFHVVPGGRYTRMYGTDYNPHTYGYMGSAVDYKHWAGGHWTESRADQKTGTLKKEHDDAGGGHAHSGAAIYLGENFPAAYRNTLFTCNIHGSRLNNDGLERTATGMKGVRRPDFAFANDPWFRGICVKQGPGGELFFSDWSDTGECHNYNVADITNGRIYRVVYEGHKPWKGDVAKMTDQELVDAQLSMNEWLVRRARLQLQMRASTNEEAKKRIVDLLMKLSWDQSKPIVRNYERRVWALHAVGGIDRFSYVELAKDDFSNGWLLRAGVEAGLPASFTDLETQLKAVAWERTAERIKLVSTYTRLPLAEKQRLMPAACAKGTDNHNLDWLTWYAVEPVFAAKPTELTDAQLRAMETRLVRRNAVRRLLTHDPAKEKETLDTVMLAIKFGSYQTNCDIVFGMEQAFADRRTVPMPKLWPELAGRLTGWDDLRPNAEGLAIQFGDQTTIDAMKKRITNVTSRGYMSAVDAIQRLTAAKVDGMLPILLAAAENEWLRGAAIRALAAYSDDKIPAVVLAAYPKLKAGEKADAVQTLASRANYALALLSAVEKGTVPKADITAFTARQIAAMKDKAVTDKLAAVWGEVKPASANRKAMMDKYKAALTPEKLAAADASKGRELFRTNCATCHRLFNSGEHVGPDLTGGQRANLDYLLENVVDPSAAVANEYKMTQFYLLDGRVVSGIVKSESGAAVTVRTVNEAVVVQKSDIESRKPTQLSVMPEGLFDAMKPEEVLDLVKYLQGTKQVPPPK